ncbi:glycolate oxidase subunit GlcD [bacterium]|nr:glycolate oxidase subunit GlcD [bacterium]
MQPFFIYDVFLYSMTMTFEELSLALKGKVYLDSTTLETYSKDKSYSESVLPAMVIIPECETDIEYILLYANKNNQPITVRGGGSGKSGGAIPEVNGIVISFEKMNQISMVDRANRCIMVQPGAILDDIKEAVSNVGLWYPVDPSSSDWCTIGGNLAENAGGANAIKYGVTGNYVLGISGYFGNGKPFSFGGKCHKDVAGYDLKSLLIGSEGTLGIITNITLKLIPKPQFNQSFWCTFDTIEIACNCLQTVLSSSYHLSAAEFIQPSCLDAVESYLNKRIPLKAPALLCRYDSDSQIGIDDFFKFLQSVCNDLNGNCEVRDEALYWEVRRSISEALGHYYKHKYSEDITVPLAQVPVFLNHVKSFEVPGTCIVCYGHLGDGNIHTNILNESLPETEWLVTKETIIRNIMSYTVASGGTLTGEHGIGLTKKAYMPLYFSEHELAIFKGIKQVCDPNTILNPSKLV